MSAGTQQPKPTLKETPRVAYLKTTNGIPAFYFKVIRGNDYVRVAVMDRRWNSENYALGLSTLEKYRQTGDIEPVERSATPFGGDSDGE